MGKDKDLYKAGKAAAKAIKYNIIPGPSSSPAGTISAANSKSSRQGTEGKHRSSLDSSLQRPPVSPSSPYAVPPGRRSQNPDSRPPSTNANRRWSADAGYYSLGNVPPIADRGALAAPGYGYGYSSSSPSRPGSAEGESFKRYANVYGGHADDNDDYIERDLAEMSAAHEEPRMPHSATSPGPFGRTPSYGGLVMHPPSSAGSYAGAAGIGTAAADAAAAVAAAAMYNAAPPPPPSIGGPMRGNSMEVGLLYSAGSGSGSAGGVGYGPYGLYAEAPVYAAPGGYATNSNGPSHYGHDFVTSPHPESINSGGTLYDSGADMHYAYSPTPAMHASTSSDYPDLYWDADAPPNAIFGVSAPHHLPGMQGAAARATLTRNHQIGGDLPGFPNWSRTWYGGHMSADGHAYTTVPPGPSASGWEAETLGSGSGHGAPRMPYGRHYGPAGGVDDYVKEERMRMLAKEFGPKVKRKGEKDDDSDNEENDEEDEDANLPSGSITKAGKIVHSWPRLFSATRALQVILSLLTMLVGIGSALLIKPGKDKPPPQGTLPSFVLYGVTVLSTLVMLYLFVFRPCCCDPQKRMSKAGPGSMMLGGGMVIPVLGGGPHGKKSKNPFAGKKNKKMGAGTTVNLIVDPAMMGGRGGGADDDSDDDSCSDEENESSADAARKARRRRRRRNKRNKVLNMRLQARWVVERKFLKVLLAWDIILMLLWIAADVMTIFVGKKCPSGSSNGWCDWYNGAIACSCISTVVFLLAIWWDISDLRASSKGPRPGFPAGV